MPIISADPGSHRAESHQNKYNVHSNMLNKETASIKTAIFLFFILITSFQINYTEKFYKQKYDYDIAVQNAAVRKIFFIKTTLSFRHYS